MSGGYLNLDPTVSTSEAKGRWGANSVRDFRLEGSWPGFNVDIQYLVVAGGAGGGRYGGGGGGGVLDYVFNTIFNELSIELTIGAGGVGNGATLDVPGGSGTNSTVSASREVFSGYSDVYAIGGGGGGGYPTNPPPPGTTWKAVSGGSGGGGAANNIDLTGTSGGTGLQPAYFSGYGNSGGTGQTVTGADGIIGGGGGGASSAGSDGANLTGGNGGQGRSSLISGSSQIYGSGGGGGTYQNLANGGIAGLGGTNAGNGSTENGDTYGATSATENFGGGGGGGGQTSGIAGNGGSGVVIIKYPDSIRPISSIDPGLTYDEPTVSGYRVYRFTAGTGTVTF